MPTSLRATLRTPSFKNGQSRAFSRRVSVANCPEGKRGPSGALGAAQSDPQGRWEASRATGRELCDTARGQPEGLPQAEAWAERERVPSGHNCRRQLATGRPEQIQEPGTAVPGTPIFANNAQRGGPPLESPCRWLSLVLSFASKESTTPFRGGSPTPAPWSARQAPRREFLTTKLSVNVTSRGLSARPLHPFGFSYRKKPIRQVPPPRRSRHVNPHRGIFTAKLAFPAACRGAFKTFKRNHPKVHRCRNQHESP